MRNALSIGEGSGASSSSARCRSFSCWSSSGRAAAAPPDAPAQAPEEPLIRRPSRSGRPRACVSRHAFGLRAASQRCPVRPGAARRKDSRCRSPACSTEPSCSGSRGFRPGRPRPRRQRGADQGAARQARRALRQAGVQGRCGQEGQGRAGGPRARPEDSAGREGAAVLRRTPPCLERRGRGVRTSPGRCGQVLETLVGNIPVYNNVREGDGRRRSASTAAWSPCRQCGRRRRGRADPSQSRARQIFIPTGR